jgi:hypothetical protein
MSDWPTLPLSPHCESMLCAVHTRARQILRAKTIKSALVLSHGSLLGCCGRSTAQRSATVAMPA